MEEGLKLSRKRAAEKARLEKLALEKKNREKAELEEKKEVRCVHPYFEIRYVGDGIGEVL